MAAASRHAALSGDVGAVRGVRRARCGLVALLCGVRCGVAWRGVAWRGVARL